MKNFPLEKFSRSKSILAVLAVLCISLSAGIALILWSSEKEDALLPRIDVAFKQLREAESDLNLKTLSLQLGLAPNYDAVSRSVQDVNDQLASFQKLAASNDELLELRARIDGYDVAISSKIQKIEQIKASYAMLKNAVSVLPSVVSEAFNQESATEIVADNSESTSKLLTKTATGIMSFMVSPTEQLRRVVTEDIAATRDLSLKLPQSLTDLLNRFLNQAEVAIRERQRSNALMLTAISGLTDEAQRGIEGQLRSMEAAGALERQKLMVMAAIFGLLLIVTLAGLAWMVRRRLMKLDQDNHTLHMANQDVEEQLVQSAKLSALGQMVAGITHEINTPLAYVKAIFELIRDRLSENATLMESLSGTTQARDEDEAKEHREEFQTLLDDGIHGLEEISTLVRTMKNFARLDKSHSEVFSVEEGLESVLLIARNKLKYIADVERDFGDVPKIQGSPSQLRQVFLNLIVNAVQAIAVTEKRGVVTLRTRSLNDTVQIDIRDNGPGIPPHVMPHIFDPFFTTKPVGEGTGMGLSICYKIVENHGGMISVASTQGTGTTFTVRLPLQIEEPKGSKLTTNSALTMLTA